MPIVVEVEEGSAVQECITKLSKRACKAWCGSQEDIPMVSLTN